MQHRRSAGHVVFALSLSLWGCRPRALSGPAEAPEPPASTPAPDVSPPREAPPRVVQPPPAPRPLPPTAADAGPREPLVTGQGPRPGSPSSFSPIVRAVRSSVVSVFASVPNDDPGGFAWGSPQERYSLGRGTGFLISDDGEILTNNHVVEGAAAISIQLDDGRLYQATVLGRDERLDVALLRVRAPNVRLTPAQLGDSDRVEVGEWVMAMGNPYGLSQTVTAGIISAVGRTGSEVHLGPGNFGNLLQTDASINPGNSGGPLLNMAGEVVGINVAIHRQAQGVGFAIPINMARVVVPQLRQYGHAIRSYLGVEPGPVTPQLAEFLHLEDTRGAVVREVFEGSPAHVAGLRPGDIIRSVDGRAVVDHTQIFWLVASAGVGHQAQVEIVREGAPRTVQVTLAQAPERRAPQMPPGPGMVPIDPPNLPR
ncbi:MAG: trypsin-like peptidase domain-containing protein [Myxococcales bacterium]|nr:trypsin-like peptidase domain-containing protein [Myxococcales bacterium]